jgi:FlaA1/EpsC-like NDP-sugar epimerase
MSAQKPGTYFASIVFALVLFVVLLTMITLVIANATLRASFAIFTAALSVGCLVILTRLFLRVLAAEKLASSSPNTLSTLGITARCPDTHIFNADNDECIVDETVTLTLGSETNSDMYVKAVKFRIHDTEVVPTRSSNQTYADLQTVCKTPSASKYAMRPFADFAPYCPSPMT